jgi:hypothetical protein
VVGLAGPQLAPVEADWLRRHRPAGVILFGRNVVSARQLAGLCAAVRDALPPDAEIVADQEGGPVSVLAAACGRPPAAWTLGLLDDPGLTAEVARAAARRAKALGVDRLLAPCADVLLDPASGVIGVRAYGRRADLVSRHVAAAVAGLRDGGVRCCLKHWPGHGAVAVDTHEAPAAVVQSEPAPFLAGLRAGADAVMLGHLAPVPGALPITLDPAAAQGLRDLAAGLLLFTDDVTMGALRTPLSDLAPAGKGLLPTERLPRAWFERLAAGGCDRLLCRGIPWLAYPVDGSPPPESVATSPHDDAAPASAWTEAWIRSAGEGFDPSQGPLFWVALRPDHRWGGLDAQALRAAGWPGELRQLTGENGAAGIAQLVVGGHAGAGELAPLDALRLAERLAPQGRCLTLGHPALAERLREFLPSGWSLTHGGGFGRHEVSAHLGRGGAAE